MRLIKFSWIAPNIAHRHLGDFRLLTEQIQEGSGMGLRSNLAYNEWDNFGPEADAVEGFHRNMMALLDKHRPSRMPFFRRLAQLPSVIARDPRFLGEMH